MKVTKVFYRWNEGALEGRQSMVICDITLEDKVRLRDVRLYQSNSEFYLVFPSKQDIYQIIQELNPGVELVLPKSDIKDSEKKRFEEFFFPVESGFYQNLRSIVVAGLTKIGSDTLKEVGTATYFPISGGCRYGKKENCYVQE